MLGDRPEQARSAALWDHGASRLAAYRERWQITTGPQQPLGPAPGADQADQAGQAEDLDALQRSLTRTVRMLGHAREHEDPSVEVER